MCRNKRKHSIETWQAEYYKMFKGRPTEIYFFNIFKMLLTNCHPNAAKLSP